MIWGRFLARGPVAEREKLSDEPLCLHSQETSHIDNVSGDLLVFGASGKKVGHLHIGEFSKEFFLRMNSFAFCALAL